MTDYSAYTVFVQIEARAFILYQSFLAWPQFEPVTLFVVLSDGAFLTITIVAEAILTIIDSFMIVCFPIMNLLIVLVGLYSLILRLHYNIFTEVMSLKIEPHVVCTKSVLNIYMRADFVCCLCPVFLSTTNLY